MSRVLRLTSVFALLAALLGSTMTYTPARAAGTLFVKPLAIGSGTCLSWANACMLQTAIANSSTGDQIWVQAGTYIPHPSDRTFSFILKSGVAVYGGFAGTETQLSQRNPAVNVTILSGDLNGDDIGFANNSENSFHVVVGSNTDSSARLDGFTIRGGNANGDSFSGGGMYNYAGHLTITNVTFSGNSAGSGGGMINDFNSRPTLTNVTFSGNSASYGGGMYNFASGPMLTNGTFSGNTAPYGGGIFNNNSSPTLTYVTLSTNSATNGGAMLNFVSSPTLTNVTFWGNSASEGGGMFDEEGSSPTLTNVTFSENSATYGGGMRNDASSPALINVTFSGNSATNGGGMFNLNSNIILINTLIANSSGSGDCINLSSTLNPSSSNNLIEDPSSACGLTNGISGNIVGVDPKLGPLANNGGFTQTHALLAGSPAIDAGTNANCPPADQRGVTRPWGSLCDIGASEFRTFTIGGNAGTAGVTLSYNDDTPKTAISQSTGTYSLTVPNSWNGTVTPSHPCFTFNPLSRNYNNVIANQTLQDYSAIFNPASGCARIEVKFGQTLQGTYGFPKAVGARLFYPLDSGPVFVNGTNNVPFVASERIQSPKTGSLTHFSEMMGLPAHLKSNRYAFPAYDNVTFDSQLRFGNPNPSNSSPATIHLYIGTSEMTSSCTPSNSPFTLPAGASIRVKCIQNNGPVRIESNVNIIAALRVLLPKNSTNPASFSEIMGVPSGQWGTSYIFPWYNNQELDSQLRVANVGSSTTAVKVMVGVQDITSACTSSNLNNSFYLGANASMRVRCNVNNGPLKVTSSGSIPIVASLRVAFKTGSAWTSFSEMMGLPESQLAAKYVFPWYNNLELNSQLRVGNLSNSNTSVRVFIGGQEMAGSPFALGPGQSTRKSFAVSNGPVVIQSTNGAKIIASLRVQFPKTGTPVTSFSELMGLPEGQLTTSYIFPWYNNKELNTQIRLGVP